DGRGGRSRAGRDRTTPRPSPSGTRCGPITPSCLVATAASERGKPRSAFRAHARHPRAWHMLKVLLVARGGGLADGRQRRCRLGRLRPRKVALEQRIGGGELHAPELVG